MDNRIVHHPHSKRKLINWKILLVHLLAVSTYFVTIYFINLEVSETNESSYKRTGSFTRLRKTIASLATPFDDAYLNDLTKKIFIKEIVTTLCFCLGHALIFRIDAALYITNCTTLYLFVLCFSFFQGSSDFFMTYALTIMFLSLLIYYIGRGDFDFYVMLLSGYSRIFFDNLILFTFLLTFSFAYATVSVYLFVFKTSNCDYFVINLCLFLILLWILDWIISLIEVFTASVAMFYLINKHSDSTIDIGKEVFMNTAFCLGNIFIGKFYFYLSNSFDFISTTLSGADSVSSCLLEIFIVFPFVLLDDVLSYFTDSLRFYVLPYIGIYNGSYTTAVRKTRNILFENMYLRIFDNVYLKIIFLMIFMFLYPVLYNAHKDFKFTDSVLKNSQAFKILLFTSFSMYYLWNCFFSIFYTISTTMNYVVVLFPNLLEIQQT